MKIRPIAIDTEILWNDWALPFHISWNDPGVSAKWLSIQFLFIDFLFIFDWGWMGKP